MKLKKYSSLYLVHFLDICFIFAFNFHFFNFFSLHVSLFSVAKFFFPASFNNSSGNAKLFEPRIHVVLQRVMTLEMFSQWLHSNAKCVKSINAKWQNQKAVSKTKSTGQLRSASAHAERSCARDAWTKKVPEPDERWRERAAGLSQVKMLDSCSARQTNFINLLLFSVALCYRHFCLS